MRINGCCSLSRVVSNIKMEESHWGVQHITISEDVNPLSLEDKNQIL